MRREARGRAKGREKAARRRPIKVQHMISHLIPLKKKKLRTPSGILCCSAALGVWAGEREREKDEGGKGRRRAGRAPSTRPQSMRGGRRGGRHRCPSPLIKLPRLPPVHPSHGPWRDKPDHIGTQRALYCEFRGLGRRLKGGPICYLCEAVDCQTTGDLRFRARASRCSASRPVKSASLQLRLRLLEPRPADPSPTDLVTPLIQNLSRRSARVNM